MLIRVELRWMFSGMNQAVVNGSSDVCIHAAKVTACLDIYVYAAPKLTRASEDENTGNLVMELAGPSILGWEQQI